MDGLCVHICNGMHRLPVSPAVVDVDDGRIGIRPEKTSEKQQSS